jgi:hypothetical protein
MLFTDFERETILKALEGYALDIGDYVLPINDTLKDRLFASCFDKLSSLNALTCFTKQEYTLMAGAIMRYIDANVEKHYAKAAKMCKLRDKLFLLAIPDTMKPESFS